MPLYEYQCTACDHRFELIRKFSDVPLESCPKCGGAVVKLQSAPAFHLKGSGWYITDYAKKDQASGTAAKGSTDQTDTSKAESGDKSGNKAGDKSGNKAEKSESASTDTKAASKPEPAAPKPEK